MKSISILIFALFSSLISLAQFNSASVTAAGLTCAMCTKAIYNALEKIPGVESVDADIKSSAFNIKFKQGSSVDPDALKHAVEDAGFSVAKFQLSGDFHNVQVKNDAHINIDNRTYHFLKTNPTELNGQYTLTIVDKDFLSIKEFRKYSSSTNHPCVETGKAGECCSKTGSMQNSRIYHVTL
ncbi:MAG: cation transporter [Chitinophagaceae bacterium]|nr:cation transporter [Chitinophagaceae bacterium]